MHALYCHHHHHTHNCIIPQSLALWLYPYGNSGCQRVKEINSSKERKILHSNTRYVKKYTAQMYSVSQKNHPPCGFLKFFPKWLGIFNHTYYMIIYTLDYKHLFNYFQLWRSYAILSASTLRIFTFHYNFNFYVCLLRKWRHWRHHAISYMFIDIITLFIL